MTKKKEAKPVAQHAAEKGKIDVQAATLVGNVRDDFLGVFKTHGDWKKMNEGKQREVAAICENIAKDVVRRSSNIIAARGHKTVQGVIKGITVKNGFVVKVEVNNQVENRHGLLDSDGGSITMVLSDIAPYLASRSEPEIDEDEPALPGVGKKK